MKINNCFLFAFIFLYTSWYGQDYKKLNSIKQEVYSSPKDTQLVKDLYNFCSAPANNIPTDTLIEYYKFIFTFSSKTSLDKLTGNVCSTIGTYNNSLGNYTESLRYLFEAEKAYTRAKDYRKLSSTYSIIGNTYLGLNNLPEQKKYYSKCYDIAFEHHLSHEQAFGAGGLASYFGAVKDFKEAIKWNAIANEIFGRQKNYIGYCISLSNGAGYYIQTGDLKKAGEYLDLAESKLPLANLNYASFVCYEVKSELLRLQKKYPESIEYLKKGLALMIKDKAIHNISETYKSLSNVSYDAGLFKESADYLALHIQYKDSVFNETSSKQLLDVQEKYGTEKKNAEIQLLNKENDLNKSEINRKKILIYSVIAVIVLMMGLFIFVIRSNIQKNKTNTLLENQKIIIEEKQKEIVDSINYAKRIQYALLANQAILQKNLSEFFVYFKPKAIVSGDFYWATEHGNKFYIAVCDSTGHGVPGAFMSLLNIGFLNEAVKEKNISQPNEVLNFVRTRLIESLGVDGRQDGMDAILICIDKTLGSITYSAANSGPVLIQNNDIITLEKDKMPVGKGEKTESFKLYTIDSKKNDLLYLYTDGYADQFGGPKGKKFKYKELNNLLLKNSSLSLSNQAELLDEAFLAWKGDIEQVDDVCVIGIKL